MKVTITTEAGKSIEVELTEEQSKDLGLVEKKPRTGYEREGEIDLGDRVYFSIDEQGFVSVNQILNDAIDINIYESANYYSDEELAHANNRADRLMRQLRRYAAEHGGIPTRDEWRRLGYIGFYTIWYDHFDTNKVDVRLDSQFQHLGSIYFRSHSDCCEAIKQFKGELLWYFTEYQPMLYDQTQGE